MHHPFYITTTLPYVNAQPHIGHALEFVQADVIARRQRTQGKQVVFNVGTDEHGLKIYEKAKEQGMEVRSFVDTNVETFFEFCRSFGISYDSFYRTSDLRHHTVAQAFWRASLAAGDIYKKTYKGLYCVGCESFKTDKDLTPEGLCPDHLKAPIPYAEENYFFKLSKYKEQILTHIQADPFIKPLHKAKELANFVEALEDISISRKKENLPRGVPVPDDETQVMYVWFDALTNYVGAIGYPDDMKKLDTLRPGIQICGPDNLRFQGAIRQGMLASAGLSFTTKILVHGMILGPDGNKMSKTLGNVISPMDQLEKYGLDAVRFYLIAGLPTYSDASYKEDDLVALYNARLANAFGNLLSRVIQLANKKEYSLQGLDISSASSEIKDALITAEQGIISAFDAYDLYEATELIHQLAMRANKYLDDTKPREKEIPETTAKQVLMDLGVIITKIIQYYTPIIPTSCASAKQMLETQTKGVLFPKTQLPEGEKLT